MRPYFDVHCHIGMTVSRAPVIGQSVGRCLARMASAGVIGAIPCPTAGGPQALGVLDTRKQNEIIARACRKNPDRFPIGLGIVEVRHEQAGVDELDRAMQDDGLVGFVCHPALSGHSLGGELYSFLEVVAMHNGLCLLHQAGSTQNIAAYAQRFPTVTFIIGHVSMNKAGQLDAIAQCGKYENIWFDVAQKPEGADESWDLVHLVNHQNLRAGDPSPLGRGGKPASYYSYNLSPKGGVLFYLHLHTGSLDSVVLLRSVRLSLLAYLT